MATVLLFARRAALIGRARRAVLIARGYEPTPAIRERIGITEVVVDTAATHPTEVAAETIPIREVAVVQPVEQVTELLTVPEVVHEFVGVAEPVREEALTIIEAIAEQAAAIVLKAEQVALGEVATHVMAMVETRTESKQIAERVIEGFAGEISEPIGLAEAASDIAMMREVRSQVMLAIEGPGDHLDRLEQRVQTQVVHEVVTVLQGVTDPTRTEAIEILEHVTEGIGAWTSEVIPISEVMTSVVARFEARAEAIAVAEVAVDWVSAHNTNDFQTETMTLAESRTAVAMLREALAEVVAVTEVATDTFVAGTLESVLPTPQAGMYIVWGEGGILVNKSAAEILATLFGVAPPVGGGIWINTSG